MKELLAQLRALEGLPEEEAEEALLALGARKVSEGVYEIVCGGEGVRVHLMGADVFASQPLQRVDDLVSALPTGWLDEEPAPSPSAFPKKRRNQPFRNRGRGRRGKR